LLIAFFLILFGVGFSDVPRVFHFIVDESDKAESIDAIRSWVHHHPQWQYKIWSSSDDVPLISNKARISKISPDLLKDPLTLLQWQKEILQAEGGVWIHSNLFCCKPIDSIILNRDFFVSKDGFSIIGATQHNPLLDSRKEPLSKAMFLSEDVIFPNQIFTTALRSSSKEGICFRSFEKHPPLNSGFKKIHSRPLDKSELLSLTRVYRKMIKRFQRINILLGLLNGAFLVIFILWVKKHISLFSVRIISKIAGAFSIALFLFFSIQLFPKKNRDHVGEFSKVNKIVESTLSQNDTRRFNKYENLYKKSVNLLDNHGDSILIPHVIHVIWGGGHFPEKSIANMASWRRYHPNWKIKFWTDLPSRDVPLEGMEKHLFDELEDPIVKRCVALSSNWGEKSDLLRYAILAKEGGLYIDHDVECFRSFDTLHSNFDFFVSMEPIHDSPINRSEINLTNCIIGARPSHEVFNKAIKEAEKRWEYYAKMFPSSDRTSELLRTICRTFDSFNLVVDESIDIGRMFILPASWVFPQNFSLELLEELKAKNHLFAEHKWDNSWLDPPSENMSTAKVTTKFCKSLLKYSKRLLFRNVALMGMIILIFGIFNLYSRKYGRSRT